MKICSPSIVHYPAAPVIQGLPNGRYEIAKTWVCEFACDGHRWRLTILPGFTTDGASVPRLAWFCAGDPMESPRICAAVPHDWLYASHATTREFADRVYQILELGVGRAWWRTAVETGVLRRCGEAAWNSHGADDQADADLHGKLEMIG